MLDEQLHFKNKKGTFFRKEKKARRGPIMLFLLVDYPSIPHPPGTSSPINNHYISERTLETSVSPLHLWTKASLSSWEHRKKNCKELGNKTGNGLWNLNLQWNAWVLHRQDPIAARTQGAKLWWMSCTFTRWCICCLHQLIIILFTSYYSHKTGAPGGALACLE